MVFGDVDECDVKVVRIDCVVVDQHLDMVAFGTRIKCLDCKHMVPRIIVQNHEALLRALEQPYHIRFSTSIEEKLADGVTHRRIRRDASEAAFIIPEAKNVGSAIGRAARRNSKECSYGGCDPGDCVYTARNLLDVDPRKSWLDWQ